MVSSILHCSLLLITLLLSPPTQLNRISNQLQNLQQTSSTPPPSSFSFLTSAQTVEDDEYDPYQIDCNTADPPCYNPPDLEAALCLSTIDELNMIARQYQENLESAVEGMVFEETQCLGCQQSQAFCPSGCQATIANLMEFCEGVTLPDGYSYDPPIDGVGTITGEWSDEVVQQIVVAAGRCGCNPGSILTPSLPLSLALSFLLLLIFFSPSFN